MIKYIAIAVIAGFIILNFLAIDSHQQIPGKYIITDINNSYSLAIDENNRIIYKGDTKGIYAFIGRDSQVYNLTKNIYSIEVCSENELTTPACLKLFKDKDVILDLKP